MIDEADTWVIRQLFELPDSGDLFDQLREWLEHKEVGDVRVQNCVSNLLAEPVYEGLKKEGGIAVKFLMRLHLLAYEVGLERYGKDSPIVAEALAALGDPAENSEESLEAARLLSATAPVPAKQEVDEQNCEHEWKAKIDSDISEDRTDVYCLKCDVPGEKNNETGNVYWPAT